MQDSPEQNEAILSKVGIKKSDKKGNMMRGGQYPIPDNSLILVDQSARLRESVPTLPNKYMDISSRLSQHTLFSNDKS